MEAGTLRSSSAVTRTSGLGRLSTETKASFKTSEFWLTVAVIASILISAALIKGGDTEGTDEFIASQAWLYVAIIVVGYCIGRGAAKSGSREPYFTDRDGSDLGNAGARDRDGR
jgi:hypothetical protein